MKSRNPHMRVLLALERAAADRAHHAARIELLISEED